MTRKFIPRPDSVLVGNRTYSIHWLTEQEWDAQGFDDGDRGMTNNHEGRIFIRLFDGEVADDMLREVVLHEVLHAVASSSMVWNCWDLISMDNKNDYASVEELMIGGWSPGLLAVLKFNPSLLAYLLDDREHE